MSSILRRLKSKIIQQISGSSAGKLSRLSGLPLLNVEVNKTLAAQYGLRCVQFKTLWQPVLVDKAWERDLEGDRRFDFLLSVLEQDCSVASVSQLLYSASKWWQYFIVGCRASLGPLKESTKSVEKMVNAELWLQRMLKA